MYIIYHPYFSPPYPMLDLNSVRVASKKRRGGRGGQQKQFRQQSAGEVRLYVSHHVSVQRQAAVSSSNSQQVRSGCM